MFHAASALAIRNDCDFHEHTAIISWFNREYVKAGGFPRECGKSPRLGYDQRCDADYSDAVTFTVEEAADLLDQARRFVAEVKALLQP
jgi:uncharacterized protein (UPF0332 family)